jgi:hypothetical protein
MKHSSAVAFVLENRLPARGGKWKKVSQKRASLSRLRAREEIEGALRRRLSTFLPGPASTELNSSVNIFLKQNNMLDSHECAHG